MYTAYSILKCIHILAIISWMAGLLYYYRLFIYHFEFGQTNQAIHSLLSLMEKRLFKYITVPSMIAAVITGVLMVIDNPSLIRALWFQIKFLCGLLMIGTTIYGLRLLRRFKNKNFKPYSSKKLRIMNEIPTILMILIVIMVILRPFQH